MKSLSTTPVVKAPSTIPAFWTQFEIPIIVMAGKLLMEARCRKTSLSLKLFYIITFLHASISLSALLSLMNLGNFHILQSISTDSLTLGGFSTSHCLNTELSLLNCRAVTFDLAARVSTSN